MRMAIVFDGANDAIGAVSRIGPVAFVHGLRHDDSPFSRQAPDPIPSRTGNVTLHPVLSGRPAFAWFRRGRHCRRYTETGRCQVASIENCGGLWASSYA